MTEVTGSQIGTFNCSFARGCEPTNQFGFTVEDGCGNRSEEFLITITLKDTTPPVFMLDSGALDITVYVDETKTDSSYLRLNGCGLRTGYKRDSFVTSTFDVDGGDPDNPDFTLVWPFDTFMVKSGGYLTDSFRYTQIGTFFCDFAQGCEPQLRHGVRIRDGCGNYSKEYLITTTVKDMLPPIAICQDVTIDLEQCEYTLDPLEVDNGSYSNCNLIEDYSLDRDFFQCSDIGVEMVTLTVTDTFGKTDQCAATVTIPSPYCPAAGFNIYAFISQVYSSNGQMFNNSGPDPGGFGAYYYQTVCDPDADRYHMWFNKGGPFANSMAYWRVWIDWDHSETFDPWEIVMQKSAGGGFYHTIFLPSYIPDGQHVMRVGMNLFTGYPSSPCGFAQYGEYEDYTICKGSQPMPIQVPDLSVVKGKEPSFNLYPNPVNEILKIETDLPNSTSYRVRVVDPMGRSVYNTELSATAGINELGIDVQQWPAGIYYLEVSSDGWRDLKQFVKME